jgi:uncharacterized protein with NRDE domain
MCILFIIVGGDDFPTVVCNNRDEFFMRTTFRGQLYSNGNSYFPVDCVGGGSWLRFENLSSGSLRFAIVLNLNSRHATCSADCEEELLSRGLLVKNFFDDPLQSARQYIDKVFAATLDYRPFNLVVGDSEGTTDNPW